MRTAQALPRMIAMALGSALLAGCSNTPHIVAYPERGIPSAPRSFLLALEPGEAMPLGISRQAVTAAAARAGFVAASDSPRYRMVLSAAANAPLAGSYIPGEKQTKRPDWIAQPDRSWRGRLLGGRVLRVTVVLIDSENREAWRGTGTLRTSDPRRAASRLVEEVLAKLPRG